MRMAKCMQRKRILEEIEVSLRRVLMYFLALSTCSLLTHQKESLGVDVRVGRRLGQRLSTVTWPRDCALPHVTVM